MIIENVFCGSQVFIESIQESSSVVVESIQTPTIIYLESFSGRIGEKGDKGDQGDPGPTGPSGGSGRTTLNSSVTATDANLVAAAGIGIYIPSGVLTQDRTVNLAALNTEGDYWEVYNFETTYSVTPTGASLYLSDLSTLSAIPANTSVQVRRIGGLLRVIN